MAERKQAAVPRWRAAEARCAELEAALYAIMRVTDPGDVRTQVGRERWEASTPARRIAREALGLPLMGNPLDDAPGPPRVAAGEALDAERRGGCPHCGRALVGYDGKGKCPSPYCPGPDKEI